MDYCQVLEEFIQDHINQSIPIRYRKSSWEDDDSGDEMFELRLTIAGNKSFIRNSSAKDLLAVKQWLARYAYNTLREAETEAELRERLGLPDRRRNPNVVLLRNELRKIRERLSLCLKESSFRMFTSIYELLDKVEFDLTNTQQKTPEHCSPYTPEGLKTAINTLASSRVRFVDDGSEV